MPDGDRDNETSPVATVPDELADQLMARHVEVQTLADLMGTEKQRGTQIPALYNIFYKFVQNPSTVSVETFKRMIDTDETVGSGVDFLTGCLVARIGAYQHDDPEITRFVTLALDEMENGFYDTIKEMLSACWAGYSVTEIDWANKAIGYVPQKLVPLPPSTILFETERTGELTDDGILQYQRNYNPLALGNGLGFFSGIQATGFIPTRPDPMAKLGDLPFPLRAPNTFNYLSIRIPRIKAIHFAWNSQGRFGNPYGRSMLRRCYNWWVQKWAYSQMMATALDRKGTPLVIGYADPNATMASETAYKSGTKPSRSDLKKAPAAMQTAFQNIHNDTFVVLPGKKGQAFDVDIVDQKSNAADFTSSIQLCNQLILRGLLIPALIFSAGDGAGSYALGQEHAKTFDKLLDGYLEGFKRVLLDQLVRQLIAYNFPKSAWMKKGVGSFAKRELTIDEREKEMNVFTAAIDKGIVDTDDLADLNKMREAIGFEPRTTPIPKPAQIMMPFGAGEFDDDGNPVQPDDGEQAEGQGSGGGELRPPGGTKPFGRGDGDAKRPDSKEADAG